MLRDEKRMPQGSQRKAAAGTQAAKAHGLAKALKALKALKARAHAAGPRLSSLSRLPRRAAHWDGVPRGPRADVGMVLTARTAVLRAQRVLDDALDTLGTPTGTGVSHHPLVYPHRALRMDDDEQTPTDRTDSGDTVQREIA